MHIIRKLNLHITPEPQVYELPAASRIQHYGEDSNSRLALWYVVPVYDESPLLPHTFCVLLDGVPFPSDAWHVGTVLMKPFVFHIIQLCPPSVTSCPTAPSQTST